MTRAYYNEIDPYAAQWLRNLIAAGHIAPGDVDERDIRDVKPHELAGYTQCHFFAGIGVWSHAARLAGIPDDFPLWTGSCPCQPFSAAGRRGGVADERHLWPHWFHLISVCRPPVVFGEQVASKDGLGWLDLVHADLEGAGYSVGAADLCAAGVGAPHIRQRLWFVADAQSERRDRGAGAAGPTGWPGAEDGCGLGDPGGAGLQARERQAVLGARGREEGRATEQSGGPSGGVADADGRERHGLAGGEGCQHDGAAAGRDESDRQPERRGALSGFWADADWLPCRDGKARPVEPGPQQMADGSADCVGRLRPEDIAEIEEEVNAWAKRHRADGGQELQNLWWSLSAEAVRERPAGGPWGLFEAPVLLAFLRQLAEQGWGFADALACSGAAPSRVVLRRLWIDGAAACAPRERGLVEQQPGEPTNPLRELSQIVARHAESAWGETCRAYAARGFPLTRNAPARVGRLRAYGNAIVAPVAAEFIEAWIEAAAECQPTTQQDAA